MKKTIIKSLSKIFRGNLSTNKKKKISNKNSKEVSKNTQEYIRKIANKFKGNNR